ncbi:hypothetical protein FB451DRAFT_1452510 [Mycena latifolia]|nr:hypothetical protein FB451DRAFT_1452510 [Mycena latifolia]
MVCADVADVQGCIHVVAGALAVGVHELAQHGAKRVVVEGREVDRRGSRGCGGGRRVGPLHGTEPLADGLLRGGYRCVTRATLAGVGATFSTTPRQEVMSPMAVTELLKLAVCWLLAFTRAVSVPLSEAAAGARWQSLTTAVKLRGDRCGVNVADARRVNCRNSWRSPCRASRGSRRSAFWFSADLSYLVSPGTKTTACKNGLGVVCAVKAREVEAALPERSRRLSFYCAAAGTAANSGTAASAGGGATVVGVRECGDVEEHGDIGRGGRGS